MKRLNTKGFTIIELMIATIVFSLVLLVVTGAIIQFGRVYYKGTVQSRTQETARAVTQDIAQSIQFGGGIPTQPQSTSVGNYTYFCVGSRQYTYTLNQQLGTESGQVRHVLVVSDSGCSGQPPVGMDTGNLAMGVRELMGERMQLLDLRVPQVVGTNDLWQVGVRVAYGQNDDLEADKKACKPIIAGGQFCAVAELNTVAKRRY